MLDGPQSAPVPQTEVIYGVAPDETRITVPEAKSLVDLSASFARQGVSYETRRLLATSALESTIRLGKALDSPSYNATLDMLGERTVRSLNELLKMADLSERASNANRRQPAHQVDLYVQGLRERAATNPTAQRDSKS